MAYRTLGEMRAELIRRLGFGASGASAGVITGTVDSFLQNAYVQIYWAMDWKRLRKYVDKTIGVGQNLIDYPTDANDERILRLNVVDGGVFRPMKAGIPDAAYTNLDVNGIPSLYEFYDQIEVMPPADNTYTIRIWYITEMVRFSQDQDRPNVDDRLVFLHALSNAKLHYKQADGQIYQGQLEALLNKMKSKSWTQKVFDPNDNWDDDIPLPKPRVI